LLKKALWPSFWISRGIHLLQKAKQNANSLLPLTHQKLGSDGFFNKLLDNYLDTAGDLAEHPRQCVRIVLATCGDGQRFARAAIEGVRNENNLQMEPEKENS
jgi:hypothetical protein